MQIEDVKIGMFIKKGIGLFKIKGEYQPTMEIKQVGRHKKSSSLVYINSKFAFKLTDLKFVSREEHERLNELWQNTVISEVRDQEPDMTCFTTTTGEKQEKMKYDSEMSVRKALFEMRIRYPDKTFEAYKCPNCGFFHIGKPKT